MSILYCEFHQKPIDTDYDIHFDDKEQCLDACTHENIIQEAVHDSELNRDDFVKVCENCEEVIDDEELFKKNKHL